MSTGSFTPIFLLKTSITYSLLSKEHSIMSQHIQSHSASWPPTTASKQTVGDSSGTVNRGVVIRIETAVLPIPLAKKNTAFSKLMARLDSSEEHRSGMAEARNWMAEKVLGDEGDTIRTLRLKKGLSQTQFAGLLGTTQAQVARLEKGNTDPQRSTCKKLREVLEISADKLEEIMDRQEKAYELKAKK
jgi:ribosome-binding protein aMBF1 (putative translation factor)